MSSLIPRLAGGTQALADVPRASTRLACTRLASPLMASPGLASARLAWAGLVVAALTVGCSPHTPSVSPEPTATVATDSRVTATGQSAPLTPAAVVTAADWTTFGRTAARGSQLPGMPTAGHAKAGWLARLDGAVYAQPLLIRGRLIVATENDSFYALNPATGKVLWRTHVGTPVSRSQLPCGNIDPLGITGTPAFDAHTGWVYAVAETTAFHHQLVAVDPTTGALRMRRTIDPAGDPRPYQQRAALLSVGATIYVAYGGLAGDCGSYIGTVLGVPDSGTGAVRSWRPATPREGGMWNPAGPALAPNGHLLIPVGNGQVTSGRFDGSDSLTELTANLTRAGFFAPTGWGDDNAGDQDLSSGSPALVTVGGTTWAVIVGKSGSAYLTKVGALGGIGGQRATVGGCRSLGTSAVAGATVLQNCPNTGNLMAYTVGNGTLTRKWNVRLATWGPSTGGGRVFAVARDSGRFVILSIGSGRVLASVALPDTVPHFATPMLTPTSAYLGSDHGVEQVLLSR